MKSILISIFMLTAVLSGFAQSPYDTFREKMSKLEASESELGRIVWGKENQSLPQAYKDSVFQIVQQVRADKRELARTYIDANRDDKRAIQVLNIYLRNFMSLDELEADLQKFSPTVKQEKEWTDGMDFVKYTRLNMPGKPFIDFTVKDLNGKEIRLSRLLKKHKMVLVDFWASWCGPCRKSMPHLKEVYAKYKDKGVEFFTVSFDDNREKWEKACEAEQFPWHANGSNLMGWNDPIAKQYAVTGIPYKVLIGHDGKIVGKVFNQAGSLEAAIDDYLEKHQ